MEKKIEMQRFEDVLAVVRRDFPHLTIQVDRNHPHVDALAELPAQTGLDFQVSFNLQNADELHLNVSRLWVEWFPCRKQDVVDRFTDAVVGILSGRYRVVESYLLGSFAGARLQRPDGKGKWETIHRCTYLLGFVPWLRSQRVVQNSVSV